MSAAAGTLQIVDLPVAPLTPAAFAPYGTVMAALEDGVPFGPQDAQLDLARGTPRFYVMRLPGRGLVIRQITRHRQVTQALASVGGHEWLIAVAPPAQVDVADALPTLADIRAFRVPGDVAVMLHRGTWHAGPLFAGDEAAFFNLELADTNVVDHHTWRFADRGGVALRLLG